MQFTFSEKYKDNVILKETFEFAVAIVLYAEKLEEKRKFVLANQILKSATSIGANAKRSRRNRILVICLSGNRGLSQL